MPVKTQRSRLVQTVLLSGAVMLSAQAVAAPGGNSGNSPGASHRQGENPQQMMMEETETRRTQAEHMRDRGHDEMDRGRERAEGDAERMRERAEEEAERGRERAEGDAERTRERAEHEVERRRDDAERMHERAEDEMTQRSGRPDNAGGPEVNPGERGSEQGQAAKRENAKAWWNFWD